MTQPIPPAEPSEEKRDTLATLRPRDTSRAKADSQGYSRFVGLLRWVLPVTVLLGIVLLLLWPMWNSNIVSLTVVDNVPNLMVEKLNLNGLDAKSHPYTLTADRALQAATSKNLIDLEGPKGELALDNGAWLDGRADRGCLDQNTKQLWLGGNVEFFHDKGYRFSSSEMNVDMPKGLAWGTQPVVINGNFGVIRGAGFRALDSGRTIVVTGPATATLDLQERPRSDKPNVNHSPSR
ncbi:MAG: LPS export ABC transporter periplasmic protein LptC [Bdellovibrionales bacterium]|jgi:lipopolysaccharide export system protein LptC